MLIGDSTMYLGNILRKGHFVYASGRHGDSYIDKDIIFMSYKIHTLAGALAKKLFDELNFTEVGVFLGANACGAILSCLVADYFYELVAHRYNTSFICTPVDLTSLSVFAEKYKDDLKIRPGMRKNLKDKNVVLLDDVLTTGSTLLKLTKEANACGANVILAGVLFNRGKVEAKDTGAPRLISLVEMELSSWEPAECPLCKDGVPVNDDLGHGRDFSTQKVFEDIVQAANKATQTVLGELATPETEGGVRIPRKRKPRNK